MTAKLERISTTITDVFQPETGTTHAWLGAPLLRLLTRGDPVATDAIGRVLWIIVGCGVR